MLTGVDKRPFRGLQARGMPDTDQLRQTAKTVFPIISSTYELFPLLKFYLTDVLRMDAVKVEFKRF